jgi:hypothetical protein
VFDLHRMHVHSFSFYGLGFPQNCTDTCEFFIWLKENSWVVSRPQSFLVTHRPKFPSLLYYSTKGKQSITKRKTTQKNWKIWKPLCIMSIWGSQIRLLPRNLISQTFLLIRFAWFIRWKTTTSWRVQWTWHIPRVRKSSLSLIFPQMLYDMNLLLLVLQKFSTQSKGNGEWWWWWYGQWMKVSTILMPFDGRSLLWGYYGISKQ